MAQTPRPIASPAGRRYDVITLGGATQDVFVRTDLSKIITTQDVMNSTSLLAFDYPSKVNVDDVWFSSGGGATNTAVSFARFGLRTACVAMVGDDTPAEAIRAELAAEGVDTHLVATAAGAKTGYSVVLNSFQGDRTVLAYRGANSRIGRENIPWDDLSGAAWLYVSSLTGSSGDVLDEAARFAENHGVNLALNPGNTQIRMGMRGLAKILSLVEILFLNKQEAVQLTNVQWTRRVALASLCNLCGACVDICPVSLFRIADGRLYIGDERKCIRCRECLDHCPTRAIQMEPWASNLDPILVAIKELGPKIVVITDGGNGAQAYDGETRYIVPPCKAQVVDTLGAGDAFGAAFTAAIIRGHDIPTALLWASANAASVVGQTGAKPGILHLADVEQFIQEHHPGPESIRTGTIRKDALSEMVDTER
ncbi:MAG TPA: PfkB family carbohydrate kinase [Armatimonadota bacterium]|nr:PfkB family carbohydrate kinase [Armatimonadota bacterium]